MGGYDGSMQRLSDRRVATFFALVLASGLCGGLLLVRAFETGGPEYRFLVWNLVLAWVPFVLALALYDAGRRGRHPGSLLVLGALWLLFLPNAPYIVTDFLHVGVIDGAPIWFDAALVSAFAATGLMLAFASLLLVQSVVARAFGAAWGWLMVAPVLLLCGLGIALGRIHRFNSWDALSRPEEVLRVVVGGLVDPAGAMRGITLVLAFAGALAVGYVLLYAMAGLVPEPGRSDTRSRAAR